MLTTRSQPVLDAEPASQRNGYDEPLSLLPVVHLLGVPLDNVSSEEVVDRISDALVRGRGGWVLTPNIDILRRLVRMPEYADLCSAATLRLADGMPLVWASRLKRTPLRERVAGSDLIWGLCERAARDGLSVYFLGGNPGAAEGAAQRLAELNPGLRIVGTECPPMGFERDEAYVAGLKDRLAAINGGGPDICFVALGVEKQDRIIRELMPVLPRTWLLGIGISFSFVTGEVRRAPMWMRRTGLEWVHRLIQEPRRLAGRYLRDGLPFAARLLAVSALEGVRGGRHRPDVARVRRKRAANDDGRSWDQGNYDKARQR